MKRSPIKRESAKRAKQRREYNEKRKGFLLDDRGRPKPCERCSGPCGMVHHKNHCENERLLDKTHWMRVCMKCHQYIHANPAESYEKGWLIKG